MGKKKKQLPISKKSRKKGLRTLSVYINHSKEQHAIFNFISHESKNVYNYYLFCNNAYHFFKKNIFNDVYNHCSNDKPILQYDITEIPSSDTDSSDTDSFDINDYIQKIFLSYYNLYALYFKDIINNTKIITKYISSKNIIVMHDNYQQLFHQLSNECFHLNDIKYDDTHMSMTYYDIIKNVLTKMYISNFYHVKDCILHKKPIRDELNINFFIEHVRSDQLYYNNSTLVTPEMYIILAIQYPMIDSEQFIIRKFALSTLTNCKIYRDIAMNIMNKAYESYNSYVQKIFKGKKGKQPKYIHKDGKYVIPLFTSSFMVFGNKIRICLGTYVRNNYNQICGTNYKIVKQNKMVTIYEDNNGNKFDGGFMYVKMPEKQKGELMIKGKKIKLIQIVPKYDGYKFKLNLTYDTDSKNDEEDHVENNIIENNIIENNIIENNIIENNIIENNIIENNIIENNIDNQINNSISIDLGIANLMTIYDPNGYQYIIKGGPVIAINEYYNKKIGVHQRKIKPYELYTCNYIRNLYIKRENKLDNVFNIIVNILYGMYKDKEKIIIGYNSGWKQEINLGTDTNRKFCQIPYKKLLDKLKDKFGKKRIIEVEESYTSKVDSLSLESICRHDVYMGKRIRRGLFSSGTGKLINADINGAINIMRKHYITDGCDLKEIKGTNILNPQKIKYSHRESTKKSRLMGNGQ